jgi:hypothetical protein
MRLLQQITGERGCCYVGDVFVLADSGDLFFVEAAHSNAIL